MTDDLTKRLIDAGLTKQQASSATARTLVNLFMHEDERFLIKEAQNQVSEMRSLVKDLQAEYEILKSRISTISETLLSIAEAQEKHGEITENRAKNIVALYGALLTMNETAGADPNDSIKNAGYIVYAYLGGQAKREITYAAE